MCAREQVAASGWAKLKKNDHAYARRRPVGVYGADATRAVSLTAMPLGRRALCTKDMAVASVESLNQWLVLVARDLGHKRLGHNCV